MELKKIYICESCGKEHDGSYGSGRFCSLSCKNKRDGNKISESIKSHYKIYKEQHPYEYITKDFICTCNICNKTYIINTTQKNFDNNNYRKTCSSKCAHSRKFSNEIKDKIAISVHNSTKTERICRNCGKKYFFNDINFPTSTKMFCSTECYNNYKINNGFLTEEGRNKISTTARKTLSKLENVKRSKNEIEFYNLCKAYFLNVDNNKPIFNGWDADIIIHDIKCAVLWNGIWHYKKITKKHSLEQVQNRDKIKLKEIKNFGYIPYIIKDMGKYNKEFVKKEFDIFLQHINK